MNAAFRLVLQDRGRRGTLYTVQFAGAPRTELDAFLDDPACRAEPEFLDLVQRLEDMLDRQGFRRGWFVTQPKYPTPLGYLSYERSRLRLYCLYFGDVVVAGSGGVKLTRRLQDTPATDAAYTRLCYVNQRLQARVSDRELRIAPNDLIGSLDFDEEDDS